MTSRVLKRRALLGAALVSPVALSTAACVPMAEMFGQRQTTTLSPRGDRLVRLIQNTGKDNMMAPEVPALMGITNEGRDIPVRQLAEDGSDGRYVVSLINIRKIHEFIFHRRQGDVLIAWENDAFLAFEEFGKDKFEIISPPANPSASSRPISRQASVRVGWVPPRP